MQIFPLRACHSAYRSGEAEEPQLYETNIKFTNVPNVGGKSWAVQTLWNRIGLLEPQLSHGRANDERHQQRAAESPDSTQFFLRRGLRRQRLDAAFQNALDAELQRFLVQGRGPARRRILLLCVSGLKLLALAPDRGFG